MRVCPKHTHILQVASSLSSMVSFVSISYASLSDVLVVVVPTRTPNDDDNNVHNVVGGNNVHDRRTAETEAETETENEEEADVDRHDDNDDDVLTQHIMMMMAQNNGNLQHEITNDGEHNNNNNDNNNNDNQYNYFSHDNDEEEVACLINTTRNNNNNNIQEEDISQQSSSSKKQESALLLAPGFGLLITSFHLGFAFGPTIPIVLFGQQQHNNNNNYPIHTAYMSLIILFIGFIVAVFLLPETLPEHIQQENRLMLLQQQQQQQSTHQQRQSQLYIEDGIRSSLLSDRVVVTDVEQRGTNPFSICGTVQCTMSKFIPRPIWYAIQRPFNEISILNRDHVLRFVAASSFFCSMSFSSELTLFIYYVEDNLDFRSNDIATMLLVFGFVGMFVQGGLLQPLIKCMGEQTLLLSTCITGIIHSVFYYSAQDKETMFVGLIVSQWTKLNLSLLPSVASKDASKNEQGRIQGALSASNAVANAIGPLLMEFVYHKTRTHQTFGPGFMWLCSGMNYAIATILVFAITITNSNDTTSSSAGVAAATTEETTTTTTATTANAITNAMNRSLSTSSLGGEGLLSSSDNRTTQSSPEGYQVLSSRRSRKNGIEEPLLHNHHS